MVHALEEIRRVLAPDSTLLDLRPLADRWPIEIVRGTSPLETGRVIDLPAGLGDDGAANVAIEEAVRLGWFKRERELTFPLFIYWDNPNEMIGYVTESWVDFVQVDEKVQKVTQTAWDNAGIGRRVRLKLKMLLTLLQKQ